MLYKTIKKFLEEVDLTEYTQGEPSNPGLPKEFFSSLEEPSETKPINGYAARDLTYKNLEDKKKEIDASLEEAAKEVIVEYYSDFFTQKNISLDIKISSGVDIYNFYEENKIVKETDFDYINNLTEDDYDDISEIDDEIINNTDDEIDDNYDDDEIKFEGIYNEGKLTKLDIHKMKLINNIVQGEGINTKALINLPSTKEKLIEIFKNYESETLAIERVNNLIKLWNSFANFMKKLDWDRGDKDRSNSIPYGSAYGACAVDIGDNSNLKNEKIIFESNKPNITIKSRGIDFAMLLHETVKGIYSLAYSNAFKDDDIIKKLAIATGGVADETQDFKYGPIIAEDLMNFVNHIIDNNKNNVEVNKYASIRLYTYRFLCELDSEDFLKIFKGILYYSTKNRLEKRHKNRDYIINSEVDNFILYSKSKITNIVDKVIVKLIEKEKRREEKERRKKEWDEYQKQLKEWNELQKNKKYPSLKIDTQDSEEIEDRTNWTKKDYEVAIDIALEDNDIPRLTILSNEVKNKKIYEGIHTKFKKFKKLI